MHLLIAVYAFHTVQYFYAIQYDHGADRQGSSMTPAS